ncbi:hypothetical protein [Lysobacter xanthus]
MVVTALPGYMPYLASAGIAFAVYRRVRSHFGRQPWRPKRTMVRSALLAIAFVALAVLGVLKPSQNWTIAVGMAAGAVLAFVSLRLMKIDVRDGQAGYTPNPWIGAALTGLLVGRLAWRFTSGSFAGVPAASPLTLAIGATVVTFYLAQGIGLLVRMRAVGAGTPTPAA